MPRWIIPAALLAALLGPPADAQDDPTHRADPAAVKAFERVVDGYRKRPALKIDAKITIEATSGDTTSKQPEVQASFTLLEGKKGVVKLRGFTCYLGDGRLQAVHETTDNSYYSIDDDGSPYFTLLNAFMQIPFPHLALGFGDDATDDILMEFHQMAPWVKPTAVGEAVKNDTRLQKIMLTSDFSEMAVLVDPKTRLIDSIDLTITGGLYVQPGTSLRFRHTYTYEVPDKLDALEIVFEPGDRQRVDLLGALVKSRPMLQPDMARGNRRVQGGLVGQPAPDFILATIDGGAIDMELLRGRVVVLDFWATWCVPCRRALPLLHQVDAWAEKNGLAVEVVTINVWEIRDPARDTEDGRLASAKAFWSKQGFSLPVAMDFTDEVAEAYGVTVVPTTVIIGPDGMVHAQHTGGGPDYADLLKRGINAASGQDEVE